jgi:hypothetical protein
VKLTRRELAAAALAPAAAAQERPAEELEAARRKVRRLGEELGKFKLPVETEPAFQFRP